MAPASPSGWSAPPPGAPYPTSPGGPQWYAGYAGYGYPPYVMAAAYAWPYPYWPVYAPPRRYRAPGEVYGLVVSWIVLVLGGISMLCGALVLSLGVLTVALGQGSSLAVLAGLAGFSIAPLVAGGVAVFYGVTGVLRRVSPQFSFPSPWLFLGLTACALAAALLLWHANAAPGTAVAVLPLAILSGMLPALAVLAFTAHRLWMPSSRRHVWLSLAYGATLAPLLAIVLELVLTLVVALALGALGYAFNPALVNGTAGPTNPVEAVFLLTIVSVIAPLVEEGVKPLGALLILRRLRGPGEAFLLGLAAGIGFDMVETISYIGSGEADWVTVAIERIGAGLLHGVGAGMAALGWYYLIRGRGVRWRWVRGFGGIAYAVLQHAFFNGSSLLQLLPGQFSQWLNQPVPVGGIPVDSATFLYFVYYAVILGVLVLVTGRLARGQRDVPSPPGGGGSVKDGTAAGSSETRSPVMEGVQ